MRALIESSNDPSDIATSFYILNRSSFGGFTEQGKNSFIRDSFKNTIFYRVRSRNWLVSVDHPTLRITNKDYRELMRSPEDVFVFLDPIRKSKTCCMVRTRRDAYWVLSMMTSLSDVRSVITTCKSYNDDPWLRDQFSDFNQELFEFRYS